MTKLTKAIIDAAESRDKEYLVNEDETPGFALRVFTTGRKSFVYHYRVGRRSRKIKIGNADVMPVQQARLLAVQAAGKVASGGDPMAERQAKRAATTVRELTVRFEAAHIDFYLKPRTQTEYRRALKKYVIPALGSKPVEDVSRVDVAKLFHSMADKPTQANRTLEIVSKMFNLAEEWGLRSPAHVRVSRRNGVADVMLALTSSAYTVPPGLAVMEGLQACWQVRGAGAAEGFQSGGSLPASARR